MTLFTPVAPRHPIGRHAARATLEPWVATFALLVAAIMRLAWLGTHPGYEWDEPVYTYIAGNFADNGLLEAKTEYYRTESEPYLYHPPFYFSILAGWFSVFGVGIAQARLLAALGSLLALVLLYVLLRKIVEWPWAIAATGLLSVDAWLVFTNRISWIENTMMPIGIMAILLYYRFVLTAPQSITKKETLLLWSGVVGSGLLFGAVTVYKHVGVYFFLAMVICWFIVRKQHTRHVVAMLAFTGVILAYILAMTIYFNNNFIDQVATQVRRSLGKQESRGALTSISDVIGPLTSQYAIYWSSVLLVGCAVVVLGLRLVATLRHRSAFTVGEMVIFSWALASVIFFVVLQLKIPHYFLMLEVPLLCYLTLEVRRYALWHPAIMHRRHILASVAGVLVIANLFAITMRMNVLDDNPLQQTADWTAANLPASATVVTEESVGLIIDQPYCKMAFARNCPDVEYIITYTSATQKVPDSRSVDAMLAEGVLLESFTGFKEEIRIYQINHAG